MTQFASIPPKIPPLVDELDDDGLDTPTRIDREVKKLRSVRPAEVTELRERPRLSISELNDLDWNQVRERMAKTSFDNRGPVTRFLDLIDLPRNTIANVIASGIAPKLRQRQTDEGETAALGQPRVYTSDILKELGVRPGIVAGTLGFIGDVALDPLTYAGPPGWGAKVATKGGQIVRIGAQGRRAAQAAIKATAKGQEIADPVLRALYHENVIPRLVGEHTAAQRAEALSKSVFGDARTDLVGRLKRGDIFELSGSGGDIAESTLRPRAASDPAKDFLARYGEGAPSTTEELAGKAGWAPRMTPKGLAFGNGQTAIAHIPFTEYGIYVPGTTRAGRSRAAQRLGALAVSGSTAEARTLFDFDALTGDMAKLADEGNEWSDRYRTASDFVGPEMPPPAPAVAPPTPTVPGGSRQPWEMTRAEFPRTFFRGTTAGDTRRIDEPFASAKGKTFVARNKASAQMYGDSIEEVQALPSARILDQESPEFWKLIKKRRPPNGAIQSLKGGTVENVNRAVTAAESAGYDAVSFSSDSDIGTVILNESAFVRGGHKKAIEQALSEGRAVPPEVLAEYPGLAGTVSATVQPQPIQPLAGDLSLADFDSVSHLHPSGVRASYAKSRIDAIRARLVQLEQESSALARNFAHSDRFNADDLLNAYQKLASVRESRKALEASLDAIPGTIKSNDVTGAAYRSFRDEELAKVRGVAEAELNLPALRSELRAKKAAISPATEKLVDTGRTTPIEVGSAATEVMAQKIPEASPRRAFGDVLGTGDNEPLFESLKTGEPFSATLYRTATSGRQDYARGAFYGSKNFVEMLNPALEGEIGKHNLSFDNPLVFWSKRSFLNKLAEAGDTKAATLAKTLDLTKVGNDTVSFAQAERYITAKAKEMGHDAWVSQFEMEVVDTGKPARGFGDVRAQGPDTVSPDDAALVKKIAEAEAKLPAKIEELRKRNAATVANGVLDMSDGELEKRAFEVEALHRQFEAMTNLEAVTKGAIVSNLTNDQRALRDLSKYLLGIDDDMLKTGPMLGMATAAKEAMGKDRDAGLGMVQSMAGIDGSLRQLFGDRRSMYDKLRNSVARTVETGSPFETMAVARSVAADRAKPVIRALGLKTDDQLDKFWTLVHTRVFNLLEQANPEQVLSKVVEKGKLVDSPWAKALKSAQSDGWFGSPVDPDRFKNLMPEVDGIAADIVKHYRDLGADLGEAATGVYAPNRLTPMAAREAARKSKGGYNVGKSGGSSEFTAGAQAFEQPRSMMVYQWEDTGGKWHELTEADFGYVSHFRDEKGWKKSFAEQSDQTKKKIEKLAAEVDSFAQTHPGVDAATRRQYLGKIADPWYLNQNDRIKALTGGSELVEDIFSTNALHLLAQRQSEQFAAKARQSFSPILDRLALEAVKERVRVGDRSAVGTKVHFRGGGEGVILNGAGDHAAVLVGDTIYRPLKIDPRDLGKGMMQGVLDSRDLLRYYPEQFAEMVERAHKIAGSENDLSSIAKTADKLTSIWKSTTLAHPSWPIFNMVGLLWNSLMGGIPLDIIARHAKDAKRMTISRGDLSTLAGRTVTLNGQQHNLAELAVAAHKGWGGSGFAGEAMSQAQGTYRNIYGPGIRPGPQNAQEWASGAVDAVRGYPAAVRSDFNRRLEAYARSYAVKNAPNAAEKLKIASELLYDEAFVRKFFGPFFRANAMMEEWYKTAAYMAMLDQGQSPLAAANHIAETFYDFTNMTNAERNVRRYVIPFYSWMRNNGAYQLRKFLEDPKWAALAPKVKEAIEEAIAGENQVPEHARPSWMREQLAIQLGEDPSSRSALNIGTVIPTEPVYQAGGALTGNEGVMNLIKWFTSGLNPVLNVPLQLGAGRESFTGREIGPSRGEGDLSMSEFLANQIRPVREWGAVGGPRTAPGVKAFERGIGQGIGRATLGGRFQPFDDDRIQQASEREYRDRVENLRRYIKVAESNGDQEESLKARAKLMVVFQAMERAGLKAPAWAKKQLHPAP